MTRIIHLTDPHLSRLDYLSWPERLGKRGTSWLAWRRRRRHVHRRDILDRLTQSVRAENADLVIVTGDLVQVGLEREIREAAGWLSDLGPPEDVLLVPGNHDVYARDSWAAIRRHWGPWLAESAEDPWEGYPLLRERNGVRAVGASSACVTPLFSARGAIGPEQARRLATALDPAEGRLTCLAVHHPPLPGMTKWRKALAECRPLDRLIARTRPAFVLCGHLHRNQSIQAGDTRVFVTASASSALEASYRVFDVDAAGNGEWEIRMRVKTRNPATDEVNVTGEARWAVSPGAP